jgi:hypothetical protein
MDVQDLGDVIHGEAGPFAQRLKHDGATSIPSGTRATQLEQRHGSAVVQEHTAQ